MGKYYVLEGREPIESSLSEMNRWFKENKTELSYTKVGNASVRTSFIGVNQAFGIEKPQVFETKVEGPDVYYPSRHWAHWDQALNGHDKVVEEIKTLVKS